MLTQTTAAEGGANTGSIIGIVVVVLLVIALLVYVVIRQRSRRLRERFGPEYERAVVETGSRTQAERELEARERRHRELDVRPLTPGARDRYAEEWRRIQSRFVDDPAGAVQDADHLIIAVMRDRGYPVDATDQRFDDLSVEHAGVVGNYRTARGIAARQARGEATTEELRRATVAFRSLFDDLLGPAPREERKTQTHI